MIAEQRPLLSVEGLSKQFRVREGRTWFGKSYRALHAVSDVSFTLDRGEVLGIVGESGSGKTTVARMILRLIEPSHGKVALRGRDLMSLTPAEVRSFLRPAVRMVFQDPDAALNPAYTIGVGLARAIRTMNTRGPNQDVGPVIVDLLQRVGIDSSFADKYPDELSGGEKRRIGVCRALSTDPEIIVADEPLSGLDVVLQERVLGLLKAEQAKRGFALVLISHDLDRVNQVCDRVLVMHTGRVVERTTLRRNAGPIREQYRHPYSVMLQRARVDVAGYAVTQVDSDVPDSNSNSTHGPSGANDTGCTFARLCPRRVSLGEPQVCWKELPPLVSLSAEQAVACHFPWDSAAAVLSDAAAIPMASG